jgi:two-component system OmpR family response regulator
MITTSEGHILVVDDHEDIRELVSGLLVKAGYRVSTAADGRQMRRILNESNVDLVVLDLMLPGDDGLALCRDLRAATDLPIVMLTAKGEEFDRVLGLEMGADDYLPKPFGGRELIARIRAVLRRSRALPSGRGALSVKAWKFDRWTFDPSARTLRSEDNVIVSLSTAEFKLLRAFVERPQIVLTRDQLLDLTRGRDADFVDRSIDTRISRLRRKIEQDPQNPEILQTVWGGGYVFVAEVRRA